MSRYKSIRPAKYDRRKHVISFKHAVNGIRLAFDTQPNFRVHTIIFVIAIIASYVYRVSYLEFLTILIVSGMVFFAELINTATEAIGDELAKGKFNKLVGVSKDISAGAVLVTVILALWVGIMIFLPKIL